LDDVLGNAGSDYAYLLYVLPHAVITVSILTAMYPALSRACNAADAFAVKRELRSALGAPSVFMIPATVALIALGQPAIRIIIPDLDSQQVQGVWWILVAYAIGLLPQAIATLKDRYFYAAQDGWSTFWTTGVFALVRVGFALLAAYLVPRTWGAATVALGNSIGVIAVAIIFLVLTTRELGGYGQRELIRLWVRLTLAAAPAGAVARLVLWLLRSWGTGWLVQWVLLAVGAAAFVVAFLALAKLFRIAEVWSGIKAMLNKLRGASANGAQPPADTTEVSQPC
ncbi:MAG: hypothetical protein LBC29_04180, partial [Propionibacteriaceae bacterium]|nr:hypothetical protein [Propionibacteriaceae bacterium]